jgi:tetratricopeptide (TPR) repeat protein
LKETKNGLVSFNNFLFTNKNCNTSLQFAELAAKNPDLVGILFKMEIDPSNSKASFASTKDVSYHQDKDEVLFSMHTVFRIGDITSIDENHRIFQVSLTLTNDIDERLHELTDRIREEMFPHSAGWYRLGLILLKLGQSTQAEQIFETLLDQTTDHHKKASIYNQIGKAKYAQGKYQEAIRLYGYSLEIYRKILPPFHPDLATSYHNTGSAYQMLHEHSQALLSHEKALEIRLQSLPPNHPELASSYSEIGHVHFSMNEYQKALLSYEKALFIQQNSLPPNFSDLVTCYANIGLMHENICDYLKAYASYERAINIGEKALLFDQLIVQEQRKNLDRIKKRLVYWQA